MTITLANFQDIQALTPTMSHKSAVPTNPITAVPPCCLTEHEGTTGDFCALVEDARHIIESNTTYLLQASNRCDLRVLLSTMLDHAPNHHGQCYVANILHIANEMGQEAVVDAANAWMEYLFFTS